MKFYFYFIFVTDLCARGGVLDLAFPVDGAALQLVGGLELPGNEEEYGGDSDRRGERGTSPSRELAIDRPSESRTSWRERRRGRGDERKKVGAILVQIFFINTLKQQVMTYF